MSATWNFWGTLLGLQPGVANGQYLNLGDFTSGVRLLLQRVPETKIGKNRINLDIDVIDGEEAAKQVLALGGAKLEDRDDGPRRQRVLPDSSSGPNKLNIAVQFTSTPSPTVPNSPDSCAHEDVAR